MMHHPFDRTLRCLCALACLSLLLAACEIEGGVPEPTPTSTVVAAQAPSPLPTSRAVADALAARRDTWVIGLLDQPSDLYPYPASATSSRISAPITELLFPSPILAYNYSYTNTGVLERIPSFENGDAQRIKADVYLDVAGNITTTATSIITQVDQLVVDFHWNPKLAWSDGTPVTAADSVFAYELALTAPPGDDARALLAQIAKYEAIDDHTTRATLKADVVGWTYFLSYWTPLPRHVLEGTQPQEVRSSPFARSPLGYGPYAIEEILPGEIRMVRNEHYFGPPPAAKNLTIAFLRDLDTVRANLQNGNLDAAATDRVELEQFAALDQDTAEGIQVSYISNPIWEHIDFNLDTPALQDIRVRRAIAYATNRQRMVDTLFGGRSTVIESWVLPAQAETAPLDQITRYTYNADEARKLLDEGGYLDPDGDGIRASEAGITLTLQLFTSEGSVRQQIAELFKQDMAAVGIDIELIPLPSTQLFAADGPLFQRQFELALFAWIAGPDPGGLQMWGCATVPSESNNWSGDNFAGWCFRDADRAIREAVTVLDPALRKDAYLRQQQLWTQEVPSLPLFQRLSLAVAAKDVRGLRPDALAPITWNIAEWNRTE